MKKKVSSLFILLIAATTYVAAQDNYSSLEFVQNKGQWDGKVLFKSEMNAGAFFLEPQGFTVLLHNPEELRALTYEAHGAASTGAGQKAQGAGGPPSGIVPPTAGKSNLLHSHAYRVVFQGANENPVITPEKAVSSYENYYIGNDRTKWATHCNMYQAVRYHDIYPDIDVRYYSEKGRLKFDLIVKPGGDPSRIVMKYEGVEKLRTRNNQLVIGTSVGEVKELSPYSYQAGTDGRVQIPCKYVVSGDNTVKFKVGNYATDTTLVIDPVLVFSSFTLSQISNWGFTATYGNDGSFYAGGIVFGNGYPVSTGALEPQFRGGYFDVGIMKFSPNGTQRVYATYLGGSDNETPHSMVCDPAGNLVVLGRTYSHNPANPAASFPALVNLSKDAKKGEAADMFVCKFNGDGSKLIGSMLIGGSKNDCVNVEDQLKNSHERAESLIRNYGDDSRSEVIVDGSNNIYIAASTQSSDFPVTSGAFQPAYGGGVQDGVVLKINPACSDIIFASFLGGTGTDAAFVLKLNPLTNDIYVGGATASSDFPGDKTNVLQATNGGGVCDGFLTIISSDGSAQHKTTYLGTDQADAVYGVQLDKKGFPYVMGTTNGKWIRTANAVFYNDNGKQFVGKLQPDLSGYVYSTTFGSGGAATGKPNISPVAFLVDRCENVYVSGWGGWIVAGADPYGLTGTFGMPVTGDAIKPSTDNRDFYFIVIKKNASALLYGTFFGQTDNSTSISEHVDGGTSRYDQNGIIYQAICANCNGGATTRFVTTPGVWGPYNGTGSSGCNEAALKISFNYAGVSAGLKTEINGIPNDTSGCIPVTAVFQDTVRSAKNYIWSFGDGTPDLATTAFEQTHTYAAVGDYTVRLIAIDSSSCNVADTAYTHIRARADRAMLDFDYAKLGDCRSLNYEFTNLSTAPPGKPFGSNSFLWDFGDGQQAPSGPANVTHTFLSAGTYLVKMILADTNYCNYPDSVTKILRISPEVKAQFVTPSTGCAPYTAIFNNTSLGGQQFFWDFGDGHTSTSTGNPTNLYQNPGTYTVSLIAIDSSTCNIKADTSFAITVSGRPTASFTFSPSPPIANTPTVFHNNSTGGVTNRWNFGDGGTAVKSDLDTVVHQYNMTDTFNTCLIVINQFGCPDTTCHLVAALINPLLDVPNAFTPGRFGQNGVVSVAGFGITRLLFRIYNRWGQLVFESNNHNIGWDGTYKGVPQPMDVYAYTVEADFYDGTHATKRGDITLIR